MTTLHRIVRTDLATSPASVDILECPGRLRIVALIEDSSAAPTHRRTRELQRPRMRTRSRRGSTWSGRWGMSNKHTQDPPAGDQCAREDSKRPMLGCRCRGRSAIQQDTSSFRVCPMPHRRRILRHCMFAESAPTHRAPARPESRCRPSRLHRRHRRACRTRCIQ